MYKLKEGVTQIRHFLSMINVKEGNIMAKNYAMKAYWILEELD